ncbi:hypothetical protein [Methylobacterium sp. AMS5]|uniref:hypothetical protein n=1 Tax=Methylobacterium sp. AMS5 TaxID=925818 RepID=UPI00074F9C73|nr:hypothetical protein [Methylobacterium sp. AMS5]AMB48316.1 hypothetical protein Y590_25445 [Methylobacterium sp. AMS5]
MTFYGILKTQRGWTVTVEHSNGRAFMVPAVVAHKRTRKKAERLALRLAGSEGRVMVFEE